MQWNKAGVRLAVLVLLSHFAIQALASDTLMFVQEWVVAQGTHVISVFDDGAAYHALVPNDSSAPAACADHRRVSLSLLSSYDYASLRRSGEPDVKLDSAEMTRRWRVVAERPVEYEAEADARLHGAVSCIFAVLGKPTTQLTELRLMSFDSLFFNVLPRASEQREAATWLRHELYDFGRKVTTPSFR